MEEKILIEEKAHCNKKFYFLVPLVIFFIYNCILLLDDGIPWEIRYHLDAMRVYGILLKTKLISFVKLCIYLCVYESIPIVLSIVIDVIYHLLCKTEMVVTDKRIYGKTFKKRVELPLDSVSSISTAWGKAISVSTASGNISFYMLQKRDEFHYGFISLFNSATFY